MNNSYTFSDFFSYTTDPVEILTDLKLQCQRKFLKMQDVIKIHLQKIGFLDDVRNLLLHDFYNNRVDLDVLYQNHIEKKIDEIARKVEDSLTKAAVSCGFNFFDEFYQNELNNLKNKKIIDWYRSIFFEEVAHPKILKIAIQQHLKESFAFCINDNNCDIIYQYATQMEIDELVAAITDAIYHFEL